MGMAEMEPAIRWYERATSGSLDTIGGSGALPFSAGKIGRGTSDAALPAGIGAVLQERPGAWPLRSGVPIGVGRTAGLAAPGTIPGGTAPLPQSTAGGSRAAEQSCACGAVGSLATVLEGSQRPVVGTPHAALAAIGNAVRTEDGVTLPSAAVSPSLRLGSAGSGQLGASEIEPRPTGAGSANRVRRMGFDPARLVRISAPGDVRNQHLSDGYRSAHDGSAQTSPGQQHRRTWQEAPQKVSAAIFRSLTADASADDVGVLSGSLPAMHARAADRSSDSRLVASQAGTDIVPRRSNTTQLDRGIRAGEIGGRGSALDVSFQSDRTAGTDRPRREASDSHQAGSAQGGTTVSLRGTVNMDGRKMGSIVAAGQTRAASLPTVAASAVNLRALPIFRGTSVPL